MNGNPLLRLQLRASPVLAGGLLLLHSLAASCLVLVLPGTLGWALGALVLALGAVAAWDRALLRSPRSALVLALFPAARAVLALADGSRMEGTVAARRNVNRWWVSLPLAGRTLLVARDMLSEGEFRRLRIWALWGWVPGVAAPQLAG